MRFSHLVTLLLVSSCSSQTLPTRSIGSISLGEIDYEKSIIEIYSEVESEGKTWHLFYLQLRDSQSSYVDILMEDLRLTYRGDPLFFHYERNLTGRYFLAIEKTTDLNTEYLAFLLKGSALRKRLNLSFKFPAPRSSSMHLLSNQDHRLYFRLILRNRNGQIAAVPKKPEIMIEGLGQLEDLWPVSEGEWEFTVLYPEDNQIMYISVRTMGILLRNLYRYQHVEK